MDKFVQSEYLTDRHPKASFRVSGVPFVLPCKVTFGHPLSGGYELHSTNPVQLKPTSLLMHILMVALLLSIDWRKSLNVDCL